MVTLNSADNVLKSYYLDAISETLNMKVSPVLAKIERTSENVVGKEVRKALRVGVHGGIGAGTEDGDLPTSRGSKYAQIVTPLKNLYGTIEISDKAIRASANNEGAFVNLLNDEMESIRNDLQNLLLETPSPEVSKALVKPTRFAPGKITLAVEESLASLLTSRRKAASFDLLTKIRSSSDPDAAMQLLAQLQKNNL